MPLSKAEIASIQADAECLYDAAAVNRTLDRMAADISAVMGDSLPVILCVMNGGIIMTGHLLTRLLFPLEIDYLQATRYQGETSGADVTWVCKPRLSLEGRTVLVVDDILDEGHTLAAVLDHCRQAGAARVFSAVLVTKLHDRLAKGIVADFTGLEVEDRYVFGFGMDYRGYLRNLNGIYALGKPDG
jgi:hypoxanthine phosphoribosyltransferase